MSHVYAKRADGNDRVTTNGIQSANKQMPGLEKVSTLFQKGSMLLDKVPDESSANVGRLHKGEGVGAGIGTGFACWFLCTYSLITSGSWLVSPLKPQYWDQRSTELLMLATPRS